MTHPRLNNRHSLLRYPALLRNDLFGLLAPSLCPACEEPVDPAIRGICDVCRASLAPAPYPEEIFGQLASEIDHDDLALRAVGSLWTFDRESPLRNAIHAIKYRGCKGLARALGSDVGRGIGPFPEFRDVDVIVPVPLHRARRRERGYNQSEEIGRGLAERLALPLSNDVLRRRRHTGSQTQLSAAGRRTNVAHAFTAITGAVAGAHVLLCDDVLTTGATMNACASALLDVGAASVAAVTVAFDARDELPTSTSTFALRI